MPRQGDRNELLAKVAKRAQLFVIYEVYMKYIVCLYSGTPIYWTPSENYMLTVIEGRLLQRVFISTINTKEIRTCMSFGRYNIAYGRYSGVAVKRGSTVVDTS